MNVHKSHRHSHGFSLLELLVVIGIIGVLMALLLPQLERATEQSRLAACAENLHQIGTGLHAYAIEYSGLTAAGPFTNSPIDPTRTYASLGNNQVQTGNTTVGLGLLITYGQLSNAGVLVCPSDNDSTARPTIAATMRAGATNIFGSYAYRQLDQTSSTRLLAAGTNGVGQTTNALAFDWQSTGPAPYQRASHDENERLNIMFLDGSVQGFFQNGTLLTDPTAFASMPSSYTKRLDQMWVNADASAGASAGGALRAGATLP